MEKHIEVKKNNELAESNKSQEFSDVVSSQIKSIAGFTEENKFRLRFPREGKIHLGIKKTYERKKANGEIYTIESPIPTDYFVLPEKLLESKLFAAALEKLGQDPAKPKSLPVWLPSNVPTDNVVSSYDRYSLSKGLVCRSMDGVNAKCLNEKTGVYEEILCKNKECPFFDKQCFRISRVRALLPDAEYTGVWQIDSKGKNTWGNLNSEMVYYQGLAGGQLAGIDMILSIVPELKQIQYKDKNGAILYTVKDVMVLHLSMNVPLRNLRDTVKKAQIDVDWTMADVEDVDLTKDESVETITSDGSEAVVDESTGEVIGVADNTKSEPQQETENIPDAEYTEENKTAHCVKCNSEVPENIAYASLQHFSTIYCETCGKQAKKDKAANGQQTLV